LSTKLFLYLPHSDIINVKSRREVQTSSHKYIFIGFVSCYMFRLLWKAIIRQLKIPTERKRFGDKCNAVCPSRHVIKNVVPITTCNAFVHRRLSPTTELGSTWQPTGIRGRAVA
jgi:hypothetical protein